MVDKILPFPQIKKFTIPERVHSAWKLTELKRDMIIPALHSHLKSMGVTGILFDGEATKELVLSHLSNFSSMIDAGHDFRQAAAMIFGIHQIGIGFLRIKGDAPNELKLCFISDKEKISQLGDRNIVARKMAQPFLPFISPPPVVTEVSHQTIRTREPGILPGKGIGHVKIFDRNEIQVPERTISEQEIEGELSRLNSAYTQCMSELKQFYDDRVASRKMTADEAEEFYFTDSLLLEEIIGKVDHIYQRNIKEIEKDGSGIGSLKQFMLEQAREQNLKNSEWYFNKLLDMCCDHFKKSPTSLFVTKADETRILGHEILCKMLGHDRIAGLLEDIQENYIKKGHNVVLFADYLNGKEVERLSEAVRALVITNWTKEAHGAIMSKGVIPGIVQPEIDFIALHREGKPLIKDGDVVIVDGDQGLIIINPSKAAVKDFVQKISDSKIIKGKALAEAAASPSRTRDNVKFELQLNLDDVEKLDNPDVVEIMGKLEERDKGQGGMRIGLFRTEYLLASGKVPDVEELVDIFSKVLEKAWGLTVRLPDLGFGTDKDFFSDDGQDREAAIEMNPDLGMRGIRLLDRDEKYSKIVQSIVKAVARVNAKSKAEGKGKTISLLVPMVTDTHDHEKVMVEAFMVAQGEVASQNARKEHDFSIPILAMIEVPSAAIMADKIFSKFDGGSFGTNDFVQFVLAADRRNSAVDRIRDPLHPAVLRLMNNVVLAKKQAKKDRSLSVCGVHAGDPLVAFIYLLMGIDTLSVNPSDYVNVKNALTNIEIKPYKGLMDEILDLSTTQEVRNHLKERLPNDMLRTLGVQID